MTQPSSVFDRARQGFVSDQEVAIQALFPTKDPFKMLQMITEIAPKAEMPWTVLGLFRVKFKSKNLAILQEQHNLNKIAQDRKGRLELSEIVARPKLDKEKEES